MNFVSAIRPTQAQANRLLLLLAFVLLNANAQAQEPDTLHATLHPADSALLQRSSQTLLRLQRLASTSYYRNYAFDGMLGMNDTLEAVYAFRADDSLSVAEYAITEDGATSGYRQSRVFYTVPEFGIIVPDSATNRSHLEGYDRDYSYAQLRVFLPEVLASPTTRVVRLANVSLEQGQCHQFAFAVPGRAYNSLFHKWSNIEDRTWHFRLCIDPNDGLIRRFETFYHNHTPVWEVDYLQIDTVAMGAEQTIYAALYQSGLKWSNEEELRLLQMNQEMERGAKYLGKQAPDWQLPVLGGDSLRLSDLKDDLVLLEFWFVGCTGCVKAIPEINQLTATYRPRGVGMVNIEFTRSDSTFLHKYTRDFHIEGPTLYNANSMREAYEVIAGPSFFLLDKNRRIVYARAGFIKEELVAAIEEQLNRIEKK